MEPCTNGHSVVDHAEFEPVISRLQNHHFTALMVVVAHASLQWRLNIKSNFQVNVASLIKIMLGESGRRF